MKNWLEEPLVHFLVAGALLFGAYGWLDPVRDDDPRVVHVTTEQVRWMATTWERLWHRPPDELELSGMIADFLKEELLAREARALGLDLDDTVVRRRLAQKMEFMVKGTTRLGDPAESDLLSFYAENREHFQTSARISFTHRYFDPGQRGARTVADARAALHAMTVGGERDGADAGDRFLAPYDFFEAEAARVSGVLGPAFATRVFSLAPGRWHGPIESAYGMHLVWVEGITPAEPREFSAARDEVLALWRQRHEDTLIEAYFDALLGRYTVVVEGDAVQLAGTAAVAQGSAR